MARGIFLAAWLGLAVSASAAAGPVVFLPVAGDGVLRPGEVVEVQWSGVPKGAEEMELLLSLDGGRHFPVRVTPDLEAERGSYSWRVPPFPSGDARLAIRVNVGGREVLCGLSSRFRIAGERRLRQWSARAHGGDLWVTGLESAATPDDDEAGPLQVTSGAPARHLTPFWPGIASFSPPSPKLISCRAGLSLARQLEPPAVGPAASRARSGQRPPFSPLRI